MDNEFEIIEEGEITTGTDTSGVLQSYPLLRLANGDVWIVVAMHTTPAGKPTTIRRAIRVHADRVSQRLPGQYVLRDPLPTSVLGGRIPAGAEEDYTILDFPPPTP